MITGMPRVAIATADFQGIVSTFRDRLGMPVSDLSSVTIDSLGAALGMCTPERGSNIELMSPADPSAPLSQSLQRFLDRRGEGHFALMLESADPDLEAMGLQDRGLNVLPRMEGAGGRDIHPNSTHGVLIRVYPSNSFDGPYEDGETGSLSPGLTGIGRVVLAVKDLDEAGETYGRKFALDVSEPASDADRGVRTVTCMPPTGGVIELITPEDTGKVFAATTERFLARRGEGIFALVLGSRDLEHTAKVLEKRGVHTNIASGLKNTLELDNAATFGARFFVELTNRESENLPG